jgi:hypothetical protein
MPSLSKRAFCGNSADKLYHKLNRQNQIIADLMYSLVIDYYDNQGSVVEDFSFCMPDNLKESAQDLLLAMSEYYDEDWFPILATKNIADRINWNAISLYCVLEVRGMLIEP